MNKFYYAVYHCWEKDYYNAQEWVKDLLCVFDSLEKAKEFQKRYENPTDDHGWYHKGIIAIEKLPATYDETKFWWLPKKKETTEPIKHVKSDDFKKEPKKHIPLFFEYIKEDLQHLFGKER